MLDPATFYPFLLGGGCNLLPTLQRTDLSETRSRNSTNAYYGNNSSGPNHCLKDSYVHVLMC